MKIEKTCKAFALCVAISSCIPAAAQTQDTADVASSKIVATVYVQVAKGVDVFNATAAGKLTLVAGSPFKISGQMEGITGSHLLSVGTTNLHSYEIASNGAVGAQIDNIDTATYSGGPCGPTTGNQAMLDHSGKYFYVQLSSEYAGCGNSEWQSYKIGSNGDFTFIGNYLPEYASPTTAPIFDASDKFAYGTAQLFLDGQGGITPFSRATNGELQLNASFTETDPTPDTTLPYYLQPYLASADPHEHLAVIMQPCYNGGPCSPYPKNAQLASYTINTTTGGIVSTNTQDDAPFIGMAFPGTIDMSYDGKFVALGGSGIQVFNFNGASLPTQLSPVTIASVAINQLAWDKSEHLYALGYASQKLYVFNVSANTGVEEIGSPISVPGAYGLTGILVVPK